MPRVLTISVALLVLACIPDWSAAQGKARAASHPRIFNPDNENAGLKEAQPPSDTVLDALLNAAKKDEIDDELESLTREQKRALFEVVKVDLGPIGDEAYVVHGKPPMIGADCEWFWIARESGGKADVLLFANGLALELRKHRTNGYRDVEVSWATAAFIGSRLFSFDGTSYKLLSERTQEQKP